MYAQITGTPRDQTPAQSLAQWENSHQCEDSILLSSQMVKAGVTIESAIRWRVSTQAKGRSVWLSAQT